MKKWIDFKELRSKLDFEQVLRHYGVEVKRKGNQHHGYCPLPNHQGKRNSPSFSAKLEKGNLQCIGCGAKGNVLRLRGHDGRRSISKTAPRFVRSPLGFQQRYCPEIANSAGSKKSVETKTVKLEKPGTTEPKVTVINASLDFELKGLNQRASIFTQSGIYETDY